MSYEATISPEFATAIVKAQGSIEGAKKGKANPAFRSKYADLGACWDACRDALQDNNIAVLQFPDKAPAGYVGLTTSLVYGPTGEMVAKTFDMPLKDPTNAQAAGSAITYARRYALCSVIGICPEDDDGNTASGAGGNKPSVARTGSTGLVSTETWLNRFNAATTNDARKDIYQEMKHSTVAEPQKTQILTDWANTIKKAVAK